MTAFLLVMGCLFLFLAQHPFLTYPLSLALLHLFGRPLPEVFAEAIMRPHFGAEGRSIVLTEGAGGTRTYPIATPNNIAAAIGQVGSIIDPNEDLVVIFITTHGAPDGTAAIRENTTPTNTLAIVASSRMKPPNGLIAIVVSAEKMPEMPNRITSAMASQ